jgi:L-ascorbate metabolism protein UlaG (beta-lactamase superfamily)
MRLQRLNMDNSWHLEFGTIRVLIDPWLKGAEIDFFSWFNKQSHKTKSVPISDVPTYDVVLITQKYPDHFHIETLLELNPKLLVVPGSIYDKVKRVLPQSEVYTFDQWPQSLLDSGVKLHHIPSYRSIDPIYDALLLEDGTQSVLLATHGYDPRWQELIGGYPPITLALTPFNHYRLPKILGGDVSPGMTAVETLIQDLSPTHIVATHDEDKEASGLIPMLANITWAPSDEELLKSELFQDRLLTVSDYHPLTL